MKLIVGLGNPGNQYNETRHNAGFNVIDLLVKQLGAKPWSFDSKIEADLFKTSDLILIKPQTFMNLSGIPVKKITEKTTIDEILVIHDDIDLPFGKIRVQKGGGTAGHHGLESVVEQLKSPDFIRFRIGVDRPENSREDISVFVLKKLTKEELSEVNNSTEKAAEAIKFYLENGLEKTMNKYN